MKNSLKKIIGMMLLIALVITVLPATDIKAAVKVPSKVVLYNTDNNAVGADGRVIIENVKSLSGVKSSNKNIIITSYTTSKSSNYTYSKGSFKKDGTGYYGEISIHSDKICKGNLTYKVNGKKYTTKVEIKKYTNPVDTLKISNIESGKNLATYFKKSSYYSDDKHKFKIKKSDKPKITVKAKKGWKISDINADCGLDGGDSASVTYDYSEKTKTSATVPMFGSPKDKYKYIRITFENIKDGGMITVTLDIPEKINLDPNY